MRHLETEAQTGIDFMHHKTFDFVNFDSDTSITPFCRFRVRESRSRCGEG